VYTCHFCFRVKINHTPTQVRINHLESYDYVFFQYLFFACTTDILIQSLVRSLDMHNVVIYEQRIHVYEKFSVTFTHAVCF